MKSHQPTDVRVAPPLLPPSRTRVGQGRSPWLAMSRPEAQPLPIEIQIWLEDQWEVRLGSQTTESFVREEQHSRPHPRRAVEELP